ncbi:MAG: hypothetical protein LBV63_04090 [Candidatus Methanoplasma sp.]|jgi:hypothetical protein|nr:hypothetical protein [Candidatus Methanoplasma sp.]
MKTALVLFSKHSRVNKLVKGGNETDIIRRWKQSLNEHDMRTYDIIILEHHRDFSADDESRYWQFIQDNGQLEHKMIFTEEFIIPHAHDRMEYLNNIQPIKDFFDVHCKFVSTVPELSVMAGKKNRDRIMTCFVSDEIGVPTIGGPDRQLPLNGNTMVAIVTSKRMPADLPPDIGRGFGGGVVILSLPAALIYFSYVAFATYLLLSLICLVLLISSAEFLTTGRKFITPRFTTEVDGERKEINRKRTGYILASMAALILMTEIVLASAL